MVVVLAQFVQIVGAVARAGDFNYSVALEVAIDVVTLDRCFNLVEVLKTQVLEEANFFGEALLSVGNAVSEAGVHEAAVATACCRAHLVGVDQHNIAFGVALLGQNRRPEAGVSTADDAEIARVVVHQHGV